MEFLRRYKAELICLGFLLTCSGALQVWLTQRLSWQFIASGRVAYQMSLADRIALQVNPNLNPKLELLAVQQVIEKIRGHESELRVYLLDKNGHILYFFDSPEAIKTQTINRSSIAAFLSWRDYKKLPQRPLLAEDPRSDTAKVLFSVTRIRIGQQEGYLYVTMDQDWAQRSAENGYVLKSALWAFCLALGLALISSAAFLWGWDRRRRGIETLIAEVSHDLRSPLTAIQGNLERLIDKDKVISDEQRKEMLAVALRSAQSVDRLTNDLLDLSAANLKAWRGRFEVVALDELAQDAQRLIQAKADELDVELIYNPSAGPLMVFGDPGLLERTLLNLLENAVRHANTGGRVEIQVESRGEMVVLRILNTGAELKVNLWHNRLLRLGAAVSRTSKTGRRSLGLGIVQKAIELHRGTLRICKNQDALNCIEISLPGYQGESEIV